MCSTKTDTGYLFFKFFSSFLFQTDTFIITYIIHVKTFIDIAASYSTTLVFHSTIFVGVYIKIATYSVSTCTTEIGINQLIPNKGTNLKAKSLWQHKTKKTEVIGDTNKKKKKEKGKIKRKNGQKETTTRVGKQKTQFNSLSFFWFLSPLSAAPVNFKPFTG